MDLNNPTYFCRQSVTNLRSQNILLSNLAEVQLGEIYFLYGTMNLPVSLLYTIKSPLAKDANTLLSKYLKTEYINIIYKIIQLIVNDSNAKM
jgi:hypothetical protein